MIEQIENRKSKIQNREIPPKRPGACGPGSSNSCEALLSVADNQVGLRKCESVFERALNLREKGWRQVSQPLPNALFIDGLNLLSHGP
jgi:hypothetical protein